MNRILQKNRYLIATALFSLIIFLVIFSVFSVDSSVNAMIVEYVGNLGWQVNPSPMEISHFTIPAHFDAVFETYNTVQKNSGFDLDPFKGKRVVRYSYQLQNHIHSDDSRVFLGVLVYESRIIAGEISSTDGTGFMHALTELENIRQK